MRRLAIVAVAAASACSGPDDYAEAVECAAWFSAAAQTELRQDPRYYPGWAVIHARELGAKLGKDRAAIDAELRSALAQQVSRRRGSADLRAEIEQPDSTARRCWNTYN